MSIEDFLFALLSGLAGGLAVLAVAWLTNRIFKDLSPQPFRTPVLLMAVGVALLIIGLLYMTPILP